MFLYHEQAVICSGIQSLYTTLDREVSYDGEDIGPTCPGTECWVEFRESAAEMSVLIVWN